MQKYTLQYWVMALMLAGWSLPGLAGDFPGTVSDWQGYPKYDFTVDTRACSIVLPKATAAGKPWIWRARFWGHEPQTDLALLERGFAVAYMDVAQLFGSPGAVAHWDRFYALLTEQYGFSSRPALEGMSRGGLIVYNWAAQHPHQVACIYADAPVCDIRSWPGGFGDSSGSRVDWTRCLEAYGITEEQAVTFAGNPIDQLAPLAQAQVPLLHVCGAADQAVPMAENTDLLKQRYEALGGSIRVIAKPDIGHHPHSLEDPTPIVDFILQHTQGTNDFIIARSSLHSSAARFRKTQRGRVAFLGGSITEMPGYRPKVCTMLQQWFPATQFDFINAGIGSTCSTTGAFRLQQDVLSRGQVDLLFVEFAVNDDQDAQHPFRECIRGMEGIARAALASNPAMDILFIYTANTHFVEQYQAGTTPVQIAAHEKVAQAYGLCSINFAADVSMRLRVGEFDWKTFGGVHPADFGNSIYADDIRSLLQGQWQNDPSPKSSFAPAQPIDPFSYTRADLIQIDRAQLGEGWQIHTPDWSRLPGQTRVQYNRIPLLCADTPGATLTLSFAGTAIGLYVVAGPDAGQIDYRIDQGPIQRTNLYHKYSEGLHYPRTCMLATELTPGPHHLTLGIAAASQGQNQGHAARIVAFAVNPIESLSTRQQP